jgi:hypothetical protein
MRWYHRFFRRELTEKHLDAELRFHLEHRIADLVAGGMALEEARRRARLEFGGLDQVMEECRDVGGSHIIETSFQDLRYGFRQLRRNPGFTVIAILTLALGIGANAVIFSAVNGVLLRPLPYPNSNRLAQVWSTNPHTNRWGDWVSYPDFVDWRAQNKVFEGLVAYRTWLTNITGGDHPDALFAVLASSSLFSVLQSQPLLGGVFCPTKISPAITVS